MYVSLSLGVAALAAVLILARRTRLTLLERWGLPAGVAVVGVCAWDLVCELGLIDADTPTPLATWRCSTWRARTASGATRSRASTG